MRRLWRYRRTVLGWWANMDAVPDSTVLIVLCVISGVTAVAGYQPSSVQALLPGPIRVAWGWMLLVGGLSRLVGIAGALWPLDAAGCALLGAAAFMYATVVVIFVGPDAALPVSIVVFFAGGMGRRWWRYHHRPGVSLDTYRRLGLTPPPPPPPPSSEPNGDR